METDSLAEEIASHLSPPLHDCPQIVEHDSTPSSTHLGLSSLANDEQDEFCGPEPKNIPKHPLFIGDSHGVNPHFRQEFVQGLKDRGIEKVSYYSSAGSNAIHWSREEYFTTPGFGDVYTDNDGKAIEPELKKNIFPTLGNILKKNREIDTVIISLGDNHLYGRGSNPKKFFNLEGRMREATISRIRTLANQVGDRPCRWIGPTYHPAGRFYDKPDFVVDNFYEVLADALTGTNCKILDGRKMVEATETGDGLHHQVPDNSRQWAQGAIKGIFDCPPPSDD